MEDSYLHCWSLEEGEGVLRAGEGRNVLVFLAVYQILGLGAWAPFWFSKFALGNMPSC